MWNWDEEKVERQSVMIPKETPPQQQQERRNRPSKKWRSQSTSHPRATTKPPHQKRLRKKPRQEGQSFSVIYMKHATSSCWNQRIFETAVKHKVWVQAMEEEIKMIEKNNTWSSHTGQKTKVIGVKWIYKTMLNADGSIKKHKARLVAKGYSQLLPGIDYTETFAPVARLDTIRALIAIAQIRSGKYIKWT
ncbi:UNVERIFIED_CONTAM: hypothetical protein Scaly_1719000 [Sesamum calycinum]|uniref:Reverse transcriptase Ty1/copia-type domain-containing protein n=1 Tax=Sesamum calycinum TaxID=2727403 RepID=A0AAW2NTZ5_9LAMI